MSAELTRHAVCADDRSAVAILVAAVQDATGEGVARAHVDQAHAGERAAQAAAAHGIALEVIRLPDAQAPGGGTLIRPDGLACAASLATASAGPEPLQDCISSPSSS